MKFLILRIDYPEFLRWLYATYPGLEEKPYDEQMQIRLDWGDPYGRNLRELGHEAYTVHANDLFLQRTWAHEHGCRIEERRHGSNTWKRLHSIREMAARTRAMHFDALLRPLLGWIDKRSMPWFYGILEAQIRHYKPDVLLNQAVHTIRSAFLVKNRSHARLLVGHISSRLPRFENYCSYDLMLTSLPQFVERFRRMGVPAELHRWGFDPLVLNKVSRREKSIPVSFIGSLSWHHRGGRRQLLEYLCRNLPELEVWGEGMKDLPRDSPIRQRFRGRAWGIEMYQILRDSKITVNRHGHVAGPYAANRRLFEATGMGTLLITDWKVNLQEIFELGKELVTYRTPEECAKSIRHYLEHDGEREALALAGQQRTLKEHTYSRRIQELDEILKRHIR